MMNAVTLKSSLIFSVSRTFALFPYNHYLRINYILLLYSFALIVAYAHFFADRVKNIIAEEKSNTNVLLYIGYSLVNAAFSAVSIVTPITNRDSINAILDGLAKVDTIIYNLQPDQIFISSKYRQIKQVIFALISAVVFFLFYTNANYENRFPSFCYIEFYILPVTWLIVFQIDYFARLMKDRFDFVNERLLHVLDGKPLTIEYINRLNLVHYTLYKITKIINSAYCVQILLMVPRVIFFSVLPSHYNIVTALVKDPNEPDVPQIWTHVFTVSHIVLLTSPVVYAVNTCADTVTQAKRLNIIIHDIVDDDQDETVELELLAFSTQLLHRDVDFSVNEFFSLDPGLTTTVFELIITYVIILLQFQDTLASVSPISLLLRPQFHSSTKMKIQMNVKPMDLNVITVVTEYAVTLFTNSTEIDESNR